MSKPSNSNPVASYSSLRALIQERAGDVGKYEECLRRGTTMGMTPDEVKKFREWEEWYRQQIEAKAERNRLQRIKKAERAQSRRLQDPMILMREREIRQQNHERYLSYKQRYNRDNAEIIAERQRHYNRQVNALAFVFESAMIVPLVSAMNGGQ